MNMYGEGESRHLLSAQIAVHMCHQEKRRNGQSSSGEVLVGSVSLKIVDVPVNLIWVSSTLYLHFFKKSKIQILIHEDGRQVGVIAFSIDLHDFGPFIAVERCAVLLVERKCTNSNQDKMKVNIFEQG